MLVKILEQKNVRRTRIADFFKSAIWLYLKHPTSCCKHHLPQGRMNIKVGGFCKIGRRKIAKIKFVKDDFGWIREKNKMGQYRQYYQTH